jgi:hypothetical protein
VAPVGRDALLAVLVADAEDTLLPVFAQPRASRTAIVGVHDGRLKIALAAPPVEGEANQALLKFLSKALGVPRSALALASGERGRRKLVRVGGRTPAQVAQALGD